LRATPGFLVRLSDRLNFGLGGECQFDLIYNRRKTLRIADCQFGKGLSVEFQIAQFQAMYKFRVSQAVLMYRRVDADNPEFAKLTLL
jgi:hypothetical protein